MGFQAEALAMELAPISRRPPASWLTRSVSENLIMQCEWDFFSFFQNSSFFHCNFAGSMLSCTMFTSSSLFFEVFHA